MDSSHYDERSRLLPGFADHSDNVRNRSSPASTAVNGRSPDHLNVYRPGSDVDMGDEGDINNPQHDFSDTISRQGAGLKPPGIRETLLRTRVDDQVLKSSVDHIDEASRRRLQRRVSGSIFVSAICYILGLLSLVPLQSQYLFRRVAVDRFNLSNVTADQTPCGNGLNDSSQNELNAIQAETSRLILYMEYAQFIPAVFVSLIVGSYADYLGRKYLVFFPMMGAFMKSVVFVVVITLNLDMDWLYLAYGLDGITGSLYVLLLGIYACLADVTSTSRQRVVLFAALEICLALGGAASQIGTGYLIKGTGFEIPSYLICGILFTGALSILIFMPETLKKPDHIVWNPCVHLRKVFGFYLFDGTVMQRGVFCLGLAIFFLVTMITLGRMTVETLFVMNTPLCWDSVEIGFFSGIRLLVQNTCGFIILKLLSNCAVRIEGIGLLGLVSGIVGFVIEAFSKTTLMMYISVIGGIVMTVVSPVSRTLLSRMAPATSQGALFSSMSAVETICHLTSSTVYNQVYSSTLDVFPGAVFILMAAILTVNFFLLILFAFVGGKMLFFGDTQKEVIVEVDVTKAQTPSSTSTIVAEEETRPLMEIDRRDS